MAELEVAGCCSRAAQEMCCEPEAKEGCCGHGDDSCGCSADATNEADVRETERERYAIVRARLPS